MNRSGLKCYVNVAQQKYSNNKCYVSTFRYYINVWLITKKEWLKYLFKIFFLYIYILYDSNIKNQ